MIRIQKVTPMGLAVRPIGPSRAACYYSCMGSRVSMATLIKGRESADWKGRNDESSRNPTRKMKNIQL